jgi:hypothetical protein
MKTIGRKWIVAVLAVLIGVLGFGVVSPALASDGTFTVQAFHGINGKTLGLSRELPVDVYVYNADNFLIGVVKDFTFRERFELQLPAGTYTIKIESQEAGPLPSMTVGPVEIPEGVEVRLHARLLPSVQIPSVVVKVR